jgi:hypothetical protein
MNMILLLSQQRKKYTWIPHQQSSKAAWKRVFDEEQIMDKTCIGVWTHRPVLPACPHLHEHVR